MSVISSSAKLFYEKMLKLILGYQVSLLDWDLPVVKLNDLILPYSPNRIALCISPFFIETVIFFSIRHLICISLVVIFVNFSMVFVAYF